MHVSAAYTPKNTQKLHTHSIFNQARWCSVFALIMLTLILSGCAGMMDKSQKLDKLDISLNEFRKSLRWGYVENAAGFIRLKDYTSRLRDAAYIKEIRITKYEYAITSLNDAQDVAQVQVQISFYDVNRGTVVEMTDQQTWWLDREERRWFLDGDLPNFRAAQR